MCSASEMCLSLSRRFYKWKCAYMCAQYFVDVCSMLVLLCVSQIDLLTLNVQIKGDAGHSEFR
uniref:Uncharacterized protein n=1 Tax=Anguilla anguilla TaxID=7936 RepID=A0A0E9T1B0_ANGAN